MELNENERIDDLELKNLKIIQDKTGFCFGIDSILLTNFASKIKPEANVIDLGTGTGVIPILLSAKTKAKKIYGIEIQTQVAQMAQKSVKLNKLEEKIEIKNCNILQLKEVFKQGSFDVVVSNPPYKKKNTGVINLENKKIISRHEVTATLEDFVEITSYLLGDFGEFYMVHRPDRLVDILSIMRKYKVEPKLIQMVSPCLNKKCNMVLVKGVKNAKPFLEFEKNLYVYNIDGSYTEDIVKIYKGSD